jgi:hypothetical protein
VAEADVVEHAIQVLAQQEGLGPVEQNDFPQTPGKTLGGADTEPAERAEPPSGGDASI